VSTFYLLPPRPVLGERFAGYLQTLFPGLEWDKTAWSDLADLLGTVAARYRDVYVIYGEELPRSEDPAQALTDSFGAEAGDEIIEVLPPDQTGAVTMRRWQV
jgi:hypothetical protein